MSQVLEINDDNFEAEVLQSPLVLVDFWGAHCPPCRMLKGVLTALAEQLGDKVKIVTVDVATNERLVSDFNISVVPTLLVIKEGQVRHRLVGLRDMAYLQKALEV